MSHTRVVAWTLLALALVGGASASFAAPCSVTKDEIAAALAAGIPEDQLYAQYGGCVAQDPGPDPGAVCTVGGTLPALDTGDVTDAINPTWPPTQVITNTGSTYYEALTSCGYHPQRKMAACVVEIRQRFGFAGVPGFGPGSFEHVLLCVDLGLGLVPINVGNVHVHDEAFGVPPRWYFATLIPANQALAARPLNGTTYAARAILSWAWAPNNCNFRPVWGNQIDFRIRLDP